MQKKKILYVVEAFGGGLFTYIVDLVNELSNQYDFTIAYAIRSQTPENFKEYFDSSVKFIEIKNFTRGVNLIKDWFDRQKSKFRNSFVIMHNK